MTSTINVIPLIFVIAITLATIALGIWSTRRAQSAADFFVASRSVGVFANASAISGEYLSAASFMGVAGLIMKVGYDALWYPVCYATGYLFLLLFIAGPLRRFGAYTIPDFAEGRFNSPTFRKVAVIFVMIIGLFYTMPQMKGAGLVMGSILGCPYWVGIAIVGSVITFNVALGGMKGITLVQAFQYWVKAFAISLPIFVLASVYGGYSTQIDGNAARPKGVPVVSAPKTVKVKGAKDAPSNAIAFATAEPTTITFPEGGTIAAIAAARKPKPGEDPMPAAALTVNGEPASGKDFSLPPAAILVATPFTVTKDGVPIAEEGKSVRTAPKLAMKEAAAYSIGAGQPVPNAPGNAKWLAPFGVLTGKYGHPLLYTFSLIIALVCGTAGLPHILVRFYTNPDGRAAKRTTLLVMVLIGGFYMFTPFWGAMGRAIVPHLYGSNGTDTVVIQLPFAMGGTLGNILSGITSAGAFAAFMSTFSGLLVSMSGALAHDVYGKILRPGASAESRVVAFKIASVIFGVAAMLLGLLVESFDIAMLVGWAFAIAAASYFPLLLLGSWWRGLTRQGAAAGMLIGGLLSLGAIVTFMLIDKQKLLWDPGPIGKSLLEQPAIWGVPLSLILMWAVSRATAKHTPGDINTKMLRLHAPESLGLSKNYIEE